MRYLKLFQKYFLTSQPAPGPVRQTDFAMHLEPVDSQKYKAALYARAPAKKVFTKITYNGVSHEMYQLDFTGRKATKRLLIFAGVHGNEFAPVLAIVDLLESIRSNPDFYSSWNIRIITPLNPVGLAHQSRYNEDGRDINRDFKNFQTVGGQLQKQAIHEFKPNSIISLHEGPQEGFFVFADGRPPKALCKQIMTELHNDHIPLATKKFFGVRLRLGIWRKGRFVYLAQKLLNIYTLGRYASDNKIITLTTESSWSQRDIYARKRPHLTIIRTVIKHYKQSD